MKTARQMLQEKRPGLYTLAPKDSIYTALELMAEKDIGAILVMEGERLAGIFSERDYARKIVLKGKSSTDTLLAEVMTQKLFVVNPSTTLSECMAIMSEKRIRHLPVVENDKVHGVLSITDMVRETIAEQKFEIEQLEKYIQQ